jgi:hypothetical protein
MSDWAVKLRVAGSEKRSLAEVRDGRERAVNLSSRGIIGRRGRMATTATTTKHESSREDGVESGSGGCWC